MDTTSYFIDNKALFGTYPDDDLIRTLEEINVKYIVDLTHGTNEKYIDKQYKTTANIIKFPIYDRSIPSDTQEFTKLIVNISNIITHLKDTEKLYVHCKGGHSRSGLIVSCILAYMFKFTPAKALSKTCMYHKQRKSLKKKWFHNSPQSNIQKTYIYKCFSVIHVSNDPNDILSPHYKTELTYNNKIFSSIYECYVYFLDTYDSNIIENKLKQLITDNCKDYYNLLKNTLIESNLQFIYYNHNDDSFLGYDVHKKYGLNIWGQILMLIRHQAITTIIVNERIRIPSPLHFSSFQKLPKIANTTKQVQKIRLCE